MEVGSLVVPGIIYLHYLLVLAQQLHEYLQPSSVFWRKPADILRTLELSSRRIAYGNDRLHTSYHIPGRGYTKPGA